MSTTSWLLSAAVPLAELMRSTVFPPVERSDGMGNEAEIRRLQARVVFLRGHIDRLHGTTADLVARLRVMQAQGVLPPLSELDELQRVLTVPEERS
jgi:hypothetical protein